MCGATSRNGLPCGNTVQYGHKVCKAHGGSAPQVMRKAQERLQVNADLAVQRLVDIITPRASCDTCGRTDADRDPCVLAACKLILDKSGLETLRPEDADSSWITFLSDEQLETLEDWKIEAQSKAREVAGIIDVTPEPNVLRAEQSTSLVYQKRKEAFDAEHLPHATTVGSADPEEDE